MREIAEVKKKKYRKHSFVKIPFKPNKRLGQNFILDKTFLRKILKECQIAEEATVIEIGGGYGLFTQIIAEGSLCREVFSLEKDKRLFHWLITNSKIPKTKFIHQDALKIDWPSFCSDISTTRKIEVVGNLAYNIANPLLLNLLFNARLFNSFTFLVQKEVGERWTASSRNSKRSALSIFTEYLTQSKIVHSAPSTVFSPRPRVDGVLVRLLIKQKVEETPDQLKSFWNFLRVCFHHPRKTLFNNLLAFVSEKRNERLREKLTEHSKRRPSDLSCSEFRELFLLWQNFV